MVDTPAAEQPVATTATAEQEELEYEIPRAVGG